MTILPIAKPKAGLVLHATQPNGKTTTTNAKHAQAVRIATASPKQIANLVTFARMVSEQRAQKERLEQQTMPFW